MERLRRCYHCIAIDLPGHGKSPLLYNKEILWDETLNELVRFLENHHIEKASFFGYSMGGRILLRFQEKYPHLIDKLFICSAHLGGFEKREENPRWIKLLEEGNMELFLSEWYDQPLFASLKKKPQLFEAIVERRKENHPHHLKEAMEGFSLTRQNRYEPLDKTWFFYGEHDVKYRKMYETIKLKREIQGGGHAIHLENPEEIAEEILCIHGKPDLA